MSVDLSQTHYNDIASKVQHRLKIFKESNEKHHEAMKTLKEQIEVKKGQIAFIQEEVDIQNQEKAALEAEVQDYKDEVKEQTEYFNDLCAKNHLNINNDPTLKALEGDIAKHEADLKKHSQIADQLQKKAEQCAAAVKAVEEHAAGKEAAALAMAEELQKHMEEHGEKDSEILKLRAMIGHLGEKHENLQGEHTSAQETLLMLQEAVEDHKKGIKFAQINVDELARHAEAKMTQIKETKKKKQKMQERIEQQQRQHAEHQKQRDRVLADIRSQIDHIGGLTGDQKNRMEKYEQDQMDISNETEEKKILLAERARLILGHENDKEWIRTHLGNIDAKIAALNKDITEKKADMAKQHLSNKEMILLKKTEHSAEITELKKEFQEHMSAHEQELWKKKSDAEKQAAQLKFLQEHGDELARHIGDMNSQFDEKHEEHMTLQQEVGEKTVLLKSLESQAINLDDQIDAFEKAFAEVTVLHQKEMKEVNADVNKHAAEVEAHKRKARNLKNMSQQELSSALAKANKSQNDLIFKQQRHDNTRSLHDATLEELNKHDAINNQYFNTLSQLQGDLDHHGFINSSLQDEHQAHQAEHEAAILKSAEYQKELSKHKAHSSKTQDALDEDLNGLLCSREELERLHSDHKLSAKEEAAKWGDIIIVKMRDVEAIGEKIKDVEAQNSKLTTIATQYEALLETLIENSKDPYAEEYDAEDESDSGIIDNEAEKITNDDIMQYLSFARCAAFVLNPSDVVDFATNHGLDIDETVINEEFNTLRSDPESLGLKKL